MTDEDAILRDIETMMSEFVTNWPKPKKVSTALALIAKTLRAALDPPKHRFWGAGEADCPRDIKAGNGELHTLRCKVCGIDNPRNDRCLNLDAVSTPPGDDEVERLIDPDAITAAIMHDFARMGGLAAVMETANWFPRVRSTIWLRINAARAAIAAIPSRGEDFLSQLRRVNGERWIAWAGNDDPDPLYASNEFGGEAGEVQNVVKKLVRLERGWVGSTATVGDLADEIADGVICLDSLARMYGIDLAEAIVRKFNATSDKNGFPQKLLPKAPSVTPGDAV